MLLIAGLCMSGANRTLDGMGDSNPSLPVAPVFSSDADDDDDSLVSALVLVTSNFDSLRRKRSGINGFLSHAVSGTKRYVNTNIKATMIPTMMNTQRQPRDWITAADTRGTRFFPPRRSMVYIPRRNARSWRKKILSVEMKCGDTSAIEDDGSDSQGETPIPVIIRPMRSMAHEGAVAHQIHPTRNINCPSK